MRAKHQKVETATESSGNTLAAVQPSDGSAAQQQQQDQPEQRKDASRPLNLPRHSGVVKVEPRNVNNRLVRYINRARKLEDENSRLRNELQCAQKAENSDIINLKKMFELKLVEMRRLLDEAICQRVQVETNLKQMAEENDILKENLENKTKEAAIAEANSRANEIRANDVSQKYNQAKADCKKASNNLLEVQKECDRLRKQFEDNRKNLENATLVRVDLENVIQSLREDLSLTDRLHSQEINEVRQLHQTQLDELDGRLSKKYDMKLKQSLQELRENYDENITKNREDIEKVYENKISGMQEAALLTSQSVEISKEQLRNAKARIEALNSKIHTMEEINGSLNARIRDLEKQLDDLQSCYDEKSLVEKESIRLGDELARQLQKFQKLFDTNVSLNSEIAAYSKLLMGEEARLNIVTPASRSLDKQALPTSSSSSEGHRRKRSKNRSVGDVKIKEIDGNGQFIKLYNDGEKKRGIGGWQLQRSIDDNGPSTTFKFHRSVKMEPHAFLTVWSCDSPSKQESPNDIAMKHQKWIVGGIKTTTILRNDKGNVEAQTDTSSIKSEN